MVLVSGVAQHTSTPFLDSNGRTSWLLSILCLYRAGSCLSPKFDTQILHFGMYCIALMFFGHILVLLCSL